MQLGLIGYPLQHSKSPEIFEGFFADEKIKGASYTLFPLEDINGLRTWLKTVPYLAGFNVTIPHKKSILPFLDTITPEAEAIGAVNTVKVEHTATATLLHGYNTDYFAFKNTLTDFLGEAMPQKALILGTGGSANTVAYVLKELGIAYTKVSRNGNSNVIYTYEAITADIMQNHLLLINTTPLGMYPAIKSFPKLPYTAITQQHYLYDLVYNPAETVFLQKGKVHGATTQNGQQMLQQQAQKAWEIWKTK